VLGYNRVLHTIYSPKNYYERLITYLDEYKEFAKGSKINLMIKIKAITKAVWIMGLSEKGRTHFWNMIFWTLFHKPELISEAITQSVYGYHYRRVMLNKAIS